jgi:hypothetical protein
LMAMWLGWLIIQSTLFVVDVVYVVSIQFLTV